MGLLWASGSGGKYSAYAVYQQILLPETLVGGAVILIDLDITFYSNTKNVQPCDLSRLSVGVYTYFRVW